MKRQIIDLKNCDIINGACHVAAIIRTIILVPCHVFKSLQLVWRSGTSRFHLWASKLQIDRLVQERRNSSALAMELRLSCIDPSKWCAVTWLKDRALEIIVPEMATRVTCPILHRHWKIVNRNWQTAEQNTPQTDNTVLLHVPKLRQVSSHPDMFYARELHDLKLWPISETQNLA